jgi:hypothetical protein
LIVKNTLCTAMEFSRCARDTLALREKAGRGPVSQNSTAFRRGRR